MRIDDAEIRTDLATLCETIGERLAGSEREHQAAKYVAARMRQAGLQEVRLERFPCTNPHRRSADVQEPVATGKGWREVEALPMVGSASTPRKQSVEGDLVWLTLPEAQHRLKPGSLRGKILAIFGPMPTSGSAHRQLLAASPAAVVHIDERFPFGYVKADGAYPYWVSHYGMPPIVSVAYMDAWRWRQTEVKRLRVRIDVGYRRAQSCNAIGELPGTDPSLPAIILTSHLDTQPGNVGADDNASGVASVLALTRAFGATRPRRTLRFIAFGAEEQLSVGAVNHVRYGGITPANTGLILNFDSTASILGHYILWTAGDARLAHHAQKTFARHGVDTQVQHEITPFADCFAFNRVGIPSLWCRRMNFSGGRWQHHSRHDTLENISIPDLARLLPAAAALVGDLANRHRWPFRTTLSPAQHQLARGISRALLGW